MSKHGIDREGVGNWNFKKSKNERFELKLKNFKKFLKY